MITLPEIIVDIGVNYYEIAKRRNISLLEAAKLMVKEAAEVGIKTVKFQVYKAAKLAVLDSPSYWSLDEEPITSQRELFLKYDKLTFIDYIKINDYCKKLDVEFMATAFDSENAKDINKLVERHKIASADITNVELLSLVGSFEKPVILSVGASTKEEIQNALTILQYGGTVDVTLLHCILNYPTQMEDVNLWKILALKREFEGVSIGYSDHSKFNKNVLLTAWLLGAEVIEKHFTLDKTIKGNDHYHAATPFDFAQVFDCFGNVQKMIGEGTEQWYIASEEKSRRNARRGVYLKKDVEAGDFLSTSDVEFLRPQGDGVSPMEWAKKITRQEKYIKDMVEGMQII